jgi:protein TonB
LLSSLVQWRRSGLLLLIILAHGWLLFLLQSGSPKKVKPTEARELFVSLITFAPAPAPAPAPVSAPSVVPVKKIVQRALPVVKIVLPLAPAMPDTSASTPQVVSAAVEAVAAPQPTSGPALASTAPLAAPAQTKTISGVQYLEAPQPVYPPLARRAAEEGKVTLRVLVNQQGRAEQVELRRSSGYDRLDESARQAVLKARFQPHLEDGVAVAVYALVSINFSIQ